MNIIGVLSVITFKTISTIRDKKKRLTIMKTVNKQCLLDTPRTERVSDKTWQVIVRTRRP